MPTPADSRRARFLRSFVLSASILGTGGMGAVYLAEHPLIGKRVAIKVLHPEFASDPGAVSRFFGEARAVNEIGHASIVDIIDFGQVEGQATPLVYLIMEYLEGKSLAQWLRDGGPLPAPTALAVAAEVADALAASHDRGIVHRDLKPDNIFLVRRPRGGGDAVKVLDFGIAKLCGDGRNSARTRTGVVMGTPSYMSPEQCEGRGRIDARSDIYALGVVLFEMLTGRPPFVGEGYGELILQHLTQVAPLASSLRYDVPLAVDAIVARALEKAPERRFPSMAALRDALRDPDGYAAGTALPGGDLGPGPTASSPGMPGDVARPLTPAPGVLTPVAGLSPAAAVPVAVAPRRLRLGLVLLGVLAGLGVGAGVLGLIGHRAGAPRTVAATPAPTESRPQQPAVPPAVPAVPTPPVNPPPAPSQPPAKVILVVTCQAPGAAIYLDGARLGGAGAPLALARGDRPLALVVKAPGFRPRTMAFTPAADARLEVVLVHERATTPPPEDCPDCLLAPR